MKPSQLAKLAAKASVAADKAATSDNEYQAILSSTNQRQTEYYSNLMPNLLAEFQQFEEERIQFMKTIADKFAQVHSEKPAYYTSGCEAISEAAQSVVIDSDIKAFVNENKTNVGVPGDIPYASYEQPDPFDKPSGKTGGTTEYKPPKPNPPRNNKANKEWGLTASDKSLSSEEQRSKLSGQLEEMDKLINSETKAKEGLENLSRFYDKDPVAKKKTEDELASSERTIQKLSESRITVQGQLDKLGGKSTAKTTVKSSQPAASSGIKARGLYTYKASAETELSFNEGDILTITEQDDSGWWYAELSGKAGFVPNNYVEIVK